MTNLRDANYFSFSPRGYIAIAQKLCEALHCEVSHRPCDNCTWEIRKESDEYMSNFPSLTGEIEDD